MTKINPTNPLNIDSITNEYGLNASLNSRPLRIFTWHVHGTYLYYLSKADIIIYIPVSDKANKEPGYGGRGTTFPFGNNVVEVPFEEIQYLEFDLILFQSRQNYLWDQFSLLTEQQRELPKIYLEHDPPRETPTDTVHFVKDPSVLIVHVTYFNQLMWSSPWINNTVIEHGIPQMPIEYNGNLKKGIVVINNPDKRGRRLGWDIFQEVAKTIPLDIIGMGTEAYGLGEIKHGELPAFLADYRFYFSPIRYTSLGLSTLEAMALGIPVVGLATTELSSVIENEVSGFVHTDLRYLIGKMQELLNHRGKAREMGKKGALIVKDRFALSRFIKDWESLFYEMVAYGSTGIHTAGPNLNLYYNNSHNGSIKPMDKIRADESAIKKNISL